ncbi:hypothetical protein LCGC14_2347780, partial [marine sediment metagenome]
RDIRNCIIHYKGDNFKKDSSRRFPTKVSDHLWLHRNYKKKIFKAIKKSPLLPEAKYKYSGLAFYLLPTIVENIFLNKILDKNTRKLIRQRAKIVLLSVLKYSRGNMSVFRR